MLKDLKIHRFPRFYDRILAFPTEKGGTRQLEPYRRLDGLARLSDIGNSIELGLGIGPDSGFRFLANSTAFYEDRLCSPIWVKFGHKFIVQMHGNVAKFNFNCYGQPVPDSSWSYHKS